MKYIPTACNSAEESSYYLAPQVFAAYIPADSSGMVVIPLFDATVLRGYRWLIAAVLYKGLKYN